MHVVEAVVEKLAPAVLLDEGWSEIAVAAFAEAQCSFADFRELVALLPVWKLPPDFLEDVVLVAGYWDICGSVENLRIEVDSIEADCEIGSVEVVDTIDQSVLIVDVEAAGQII